MKRIILWSIFCGCFVFGAVLAQDKQTEPSKKRGIVVERNPDVTINLPEYIEYDKSWAILVGINKFKHWPNLNHAINDVDAMKSMLMFTYGFKEENIKVLRDKEATLDNIKTLLDGDFITRIRENDRLIFFWAGHGETRKLVGGRESGYLIPYEGLLRTEKNAYATYLSMDKIKQFSDKCAAKHILFLVDACYSGFAASKKGLPPLPAELKNYYINLTTEPGRQIITAGGKDELVVESGDWGHSAFTYKLLHALSHRMYAADADKNGLITTNEIASYLVDKVCKLTEYKQKPVFATLSGEGEMVFIRKDIATYYSEKDTFFIPIDTTRYEEPPKPPTIPLDYVRFLKDEYIMGDTFGDGEANEKPPHTVTVETFYILDHEVTNKEYFEFVRETKAHYPVWMGRIDPLTVRDGCSYDFKKMDEALIGDNYPVVGVSWDDAQAYCEWVGAKNNVTGRLPTETEWEYAARLGGEGVRFATGTDHLSESDANFLVKSGVDNWRYTAPVGTFGRNQLGLADMAGNVWEWCYDVHTGYAGASSAGSRMRVIRGGGYNMFDWHCRSTKRLVLPISDGMATVGFRVVLIARGDVTRK
ncbi:SUMF1/EgtB/PvdO family nonheme iron enzyme [candidate division KSB1 bacterium]|nr:SUMF1/EgtB/PvdO family nonheme iron enzyme [candidate division KSB1 bacterium]